MVKQAEYFLQLAGSAFGYLPLVLIPFGIWYLYHCHRPLCWFTLIFFLTDVVYAVNYDIKDIDAYFLPAFIMCGVWMASSLVFLVSFCYSRKKPAFLAAGNNQRAGSLF